MHSSRVDRHSVTIVWTDMRVIGAVAKFDGRNRFAKRSCSMHCVDLRMSMGCLEDPLRRALDLENSTAK